MANPYLVTVDLTVEQANAAAADLARQPAASTRAIADLLKLEPVDLQQAAEG